MDVFIALVIGTTASIGLGALALGLFVLDVTPPGAPVSPPGRQPHHG